MRRDKGGGLDSQPRRRFGSPRWVERLIMALVFDEKHNVPCVFYVRFRAS